MKVGSYHVDKKYARGFSLAGAAMVALGLYGLTHVSMATMASNVTVGVIVIVAGFAQCAVALRTPRRAGAVSFGTGGALYVVAGIASAFNPLLGSFGWTVLLIAALAGSGAARILFGRSVRPAVGWDWIVAAGGVSLAAGFLIAIGWASTVWLLGLLLAIDILAQGAALWAVSLMRRPAPDR